MGGALVGEGGQTEKKQPAHEVRAAGGEGDGEEGAGGVTDDERSGRHEGAEGLEVGVDVVGRVRRCR